MVFTSHPRNHCACCWTECWSSQANACPCHRPTVAVRFAVEAFLSRQHVARYYHRRARRGAALRRAGEDVFHRSDGTGWHSKCVAASLGPSRVLHLMCSPSHALPQSARRPSARLARAPCSCSRLQALTRWPSVTVRALRAEQPYSLQHPSGMRSHLSFCYAPGRPHGRA